MKFAVNYSREAAALVEQGRIRVDVWKCPDRDQAVAEAMDHGPVYVHFDPRLGRGLVDEATMDHMEALAERTRTPYVNAHLTPCTLDFPGMEMAAQSPDDVQRVTEAVLRDLNLLVDRFGAERVIVENGTWAPREPYAIPACAFDAAWTRRIIRDMGVGFVLDLAHARIAAKFLGIDERQYVAALPVERVTELHITGLIEQPPGQWRDHWPMTDEDWPLTDWAFDHICDHQWGHPWALAYEYGWVAHSRETDPDVIGRDVPRLTALADSADTRP